MKKIKNVTLISILLYSLHSFGCDVCGNYMGLTPYHNKNTFSFLHHYRVFNGYRDYQKQSKFFPPSAYKTTHADPTHDSIMNLNKTYSSKDFESFKIFELRFKYFIHKRVEFNVFLPIANNKSKTDDVYLNHTGIGDISFNSAFHMLIPKTDANIKHKLLFGIGMKLPSGNSNVRHNGNRLPFEMQSGSGSYDGFFYINYMVASSKLGFNANLSYKLNGGNRFTERLANSHNDFFTLFYMLSFKSIKAYPSIQANYEYTKGLYIDHEFQKHSDINSLLIGPGLDFYYKNLLLNFSWQFTATEHVEKGGLKSSGRLNMGISYSFDKKE